jgi:flagellar motor switch protein FliN
MSIDNWNEASAPPAASTTPGRSTPTDSEALLGALHFLRDVPLEITVELGRTRMPIAELFNLGPSSVIELGKASDEPLDIRVNGVLIARGEAVVVNERFGVRLTSIVEPNRLLDSFKK